MSLTAERARELLDYNPSTGALTWRVRRGGNATVGSQAGNLRRGYRRVKIDGKKYTASRLIFLIVKGRWPKRMVDHKDTDQSNDRWDNLREATRRQNNANASLRKDNTSGLKGVSAVGARWQAQASGKYLGTFDTKEEAHAAYVARTKEIHGRFARVS